MKSIIQTDDLRLLNDGLTQLGISLSAAAGQQCPHPVSCCFIDNPDGTLRWLWPAKSKGTPFLRFYHTGSRRSRLAVMGMKLMMKLGLKKWVRSGACTLFINDAGKKVLDQVQDWALFTGTQGVTRKLVTWYRKEGNSFFGKLPLTMLAATNTHNEKMALEEEMPESMLSPSVSFVKQAALVQSDLFETERWKVPGHISDIPAVALQRWLGNNTEMHLLKTTCWWKSACRKSRYLLNDSSGRFHGDLLERLHQLMTCFSPETLVICNPAHGDFTAWNIRYQKERIAAVDWELYDANRPALYDLFHFVYQNNILVTRKGYAGVRKELDRLLARPEWQHFLREQEIDAAVAEQLYLIHTVTYYLDLYIRQEVWHLQVHWLLQTWMEALGYWLNNRGVEEPRAVLLQDIAHFLHPVPYAALKLQDQPLTELPRSADLDLCLKRADALRLVTWLRRHNLVCRVKEHRFSFMRRITLVLNDNSLLHIDCIWTIRRKHLVFMPARELWATGTEHYTTAKVPHALYELKYTWLFYLLNYSGIPGRHREWYKASPAYHIAANLLIRQFGLNSNTDSFFEYAPEVRARVTALLKAMPANRGYRLLCNRLLYIADSLRSLWPRKGYIATFSGVDGSGKSTVIRTIANAIDKELRMPVVVLRHRPSVLPILSAWKYGKTEAEARSVRSLPRQGASRAGLLSLLRFFYYYTDYLLGQFYVQFRYVYRGYVVLYDRYYFDFIGDCKRSNLVVPQWLSYWLYRFLFKPDFNYFLFASAEVIRERKQELDSKAIDGLTRNYLALFARLQQQGRCYQYNTVYNLDLDHTVQCIFDNLKKQSLCAGS